MSNSNKEQVFSTLVHIPELDKINYVVDDKEITSNVSELFKKYEEKFNNLVPDWKNNIELLMAKLFGKNDKDSILFVINNYNNSEIKKYIDIYNGYFNNDCSKKINIGDFSNKQTLIYYALESENLELIKYIDKNFGYYEFYIDLSLFDIIVKNDKLNIIKFLREKFLRKLSYRFSEFLNTFLDFISKKGDIELLKYAENQQVLYAYHYSEACYNAMSNGNIEFAKYCEEKIKSFDDMDRQKFYWNLFLGACKNGNLNMYEYAKNKYNWDDKYNITFSSSFFSNIVRGGNIKIIEDIIEDHKKFIFKEKYSNKTYYDKKKILEKLSYDASIYNKIDIFKYIIEKISDITSDIIENVSVANNLTFAKYILEKYNDFCYVKELACMAAIYCKFDLLKYTIEKGFNDYSSLITHVRLFKNHDDVHIKIAKFLIENKAPLIPDNYMNTAISLEIETNKYNCIKVDFIKYAIENGADCYEELFRYLDSKHVSDKDYTDIFNSMSNSNVVLEKNIEIIAKIAARLGLLDIVKSYIEKGAKNYEDILIEAAKNRKFDIVKYVIQFIK